MQKHKSQLTNKSLLNLHMVA